MKPASGGTWPSRAGVAARPTGLTGFTLGLPAARARGQQLKERAQLGGWIRHGSAAYTESLCERE